MATIQVMLQRRRKELGMPIEDLAARSGVSVATVNRILSGGLGKASFEHVYRVAEAMGISLSPQAEPAIVFKENAAREQAERLVSMVQGTSGLEGQAVSDTTAKNLVRESIHRLMAGSPRRIWAQ